SFSCMITAHCLECPRDYETFASKRASGGFRILWPHTKSSKFGEQRLIVFINKPAKDRLGNNLADAINGFEFLVGCMAEVVEVFECRSQIYRCLRANVTNTKP